MPRIPSRRLKKAKEESYTPLLFALAASDSEYLITTVELLCQFGADVNYSSDLLFRDTPLHFAAAMGNDEIIELLFRHIRYFSKKGSLRSIFKRFQYDTEHSTDQRFLNSQLRTAVSAGAEPVEIRNLLLRGAEVNCIDSLGYTPLLLALVASDSQYLITTVELLCQFGADVNYSSDLLFRDTPLHFAAALGNDEIIELLFRHKADVHARNHAGYTPLHVAAHNGSEASVTALFLCGADLNCTENYCWYTPLHLAVIGQFETVVKALVSSGARINQADSSNLTPLNRCQSKSIRSILLAALNPGCSSLESSCLAVIRGAVRKVIGIYGFDKLPLPIVLRRKLRLKS